MSSEKSDAVVIGGGIVGAFTGYYLARAGHSVTVLDPAPGQRASASYGNAGMLCPSYSLPLANPTSFRAGLSLLTGGHGPVSFRRPVEARTLLWMSRFAAACRPGRAWRKAAELHELSTKSVELYSEFAEETGTDLNIRPRGWTYVFHDSKELNAHAKFAERLRKAAGVRNEQLSTSELLEREPSIAGDVAGAVVYPDDANMDPARTTRLVIAAAEKQGAKFVHEEVTDVEKRGKEVLRVRTQHRTFEANAYVIATGARSWEVGRKFGIRLPVESGHGISLTLPAPGQKLISGALMSGDEHIVISPGPDYIRITSGMEFGAVGLSEPAPDAIAKMRKNAELTVPGLREITAEGEVWRGPRPMTPDGLPIIGKVSENVLAAVGHNTLGMTLGPISGQMITREVASMQSKT